MLKSKLEELLNPGIRRLNLSSCHIDAECCEILCNFIQDPSTRLLSLDISGTRVTVAEATKIFESIKNSSILEFFADNLTLKEESIRKLAESLSENSNIKLLSICGSDMNHQCIELIANILPKAGNLQYLRLESNSMYNTGCIALASNLINSNLISLEIGDNMIWEDAMKVLIDAVADEKSKIEFLEALSVFGAQKVGFWRHFQFLGLKKWFFEGTFSFSGSKSEFLKALLVFRAQKLGFWRHFQFLGLKKWVFEGAFSFSDSKSDILFNRICNSIVLRIRMIYNPIIRLFRIIAD